MAMSRHTNSMSRPARAAVEGIRLFRKLRARYLWAVEEGKRERADFGPKSVRGWHWALVWGFGIGSLLSPSIAWWLGFPQVSEWCVWYIAWMCCLLPNLLFVCRIAWLIFKALWWVAGLILPPAISAHTHWPEPLQLSCGPARTLPGSFSCRGRSR